MTTAQLTNETNQPLNCKIFITGGVGFIGSNLVDSSSCGFLDAFYLRQISTIACHCEPKHKALQKTAIFKSTNKF